MDVEKKEKEMDTLIISISPEINLIHSQEVYLEFDIISINNIYGCFYM